MARLTDFFSGGRQPSPQTLAAGRVLRDAATEVVLDQPRSLAGLIQRMSAKRFVLLGEATHGTREFYEIRAAISLRLIQDHGFAGIIAEADWPDAGRVNRYIRGQGNDTNARHALEGFERFPLWMWRNTVVLDLVENLRNHNDSLPAGASPAGFWGMDLYSLYASMAAVLEYLHKVDPAAADRARQRYACFEPFGEDPQAYGAAAASGLPFDGDSDCEDQVIEQLLELHRRRGEYARALRDGATAEDEFFFAEQNARLVTQAERYYRAMYRGGASTWNLRDTHMADTVDALAAHLERSTRPRCARLIIWAHNSHLGDARFTEMGESRAEINVGQLLRQRHGEDVFSLGFTTHCGTVAAAHNWDDPPRRMVVVPSLPDSIEQACHRASRPDPADEHSALDLPAFVLMPPLRSEAARVLNEQWLQRAIGVIYRPATERWSHYFKCLPGRQFDAILHVEQTNALQPLDPFEGFEAGHESAPETYPSGL